MRFDIAIGYKDRILKFGSVPTEKDAIDFNDALFELCHRYNFEPSFYKTGYFESNIEDPWYFDVSDEEEEEEE